MPDVMNLNVRISGALKDHVANEIDAGAYENVSEYVRSLIRRDRQQARDQAFERMREELQLAFAAPESAYVETTAADIFAAHARRGEG